MLNIKETIYVWCAVIGVAAGCAFSYGASSYIFDAVESGEGAGIYGANGAAAVLAVVDKRFPDGRSPEVILQDIAIAEGQILALRNKLAVAEAKLAALRIELADVKGKVGTPKAPAVLVTPVSMAAQIVAGNGAGRESDRGEYTIRMDVRALNKDVYFAKVPSRTFATSSRNGVIYKVASDPSGEIPNANLSAVLTSGRANVGQSPSAFRVRAGETERFNLIVNVTPVAGRPGNYNVSVPTFFYADTDSIIGADYKTASITVPMMTPSIYLTPR